MDRKLRTLLVLLVTSLQLSYTKQTSFMWQPASWLKDFNDDLGDLDDHFTVEDCPDLDSSPTQLEDSERSRTYEAELLENIKDRDTEIKILQLKHKAELKRLDRDRQAHLDSFGSKCKSELDILKRQHRDQMTTLSREKDVEVAQVSSLKVTEKNECLKEKDELQRKVAALTESETHLETKIKKLTQPNVLEAEFTLMHLRSGRRFYFSREKKTWRGAVQRCDERGMQIISVDNPSVNHEIDFVVFAMSREPFWIGANSLGSHRHFTWHSTGQPLVFTHWRQGEPNNKGGQENCVALYNLDTGVRDAKWSDLSCDRQHNFICVPHGQN